MGVSAALPTCFISFFSFPRFSKVKKQIYFSQKKNPNHLIDRLPKPIIFRNDMIMKEDHLLSSFAELLYACPLCPFSNIPYIGEIGLQLYTLRKAIAKDLTKTLKEVAKAGYKQVEPYGFPSPQSIEMIKRAKDLE